MARHVLVVLTNPVAGREAEYNRWYNETHVPDVLAVEGIVACQRFKLSDTQLTGPGPHRYLALYEIETENVAEAIEALQKAAGAGMVISDALDTANTTAWVYSAIAERVEA